MKLTVSQSWLLAVALYIFHPASGAATELERLRVAEDQRFLVTESGKPFFWPGDTAWELFHRLNREQADRYLKDGPNNDYWDHVDDIVNKAESLGMHIGFPPPWSEKLNKKRGVGREFFTPENAEVFGHWLGQRYEDRSNII